MAEPIFHIADESGNNNRNLKNTLGELYPGATGDVLTLQSNGEWAAQAPAGGGGAKLFMEKVIISADNVIPPLSYTPVDPSQVRMVVRNVIHTPKSNDFSVLGKNVTIANTGYVIKAGWHVEFHYETLDTIVMPTITSFSPTSGTIAETVVITGANFVNVQSVTIGGVNQPSFVVDSPTQITVTLANGSYVGTDVVVTTGTGTASQSGFTFNSPAPTITNISPLISAIGNEVVITGVNFINVSSVKFGGVNAASYIVDSSTQLRGVIADTGAAGTVEITTPFGTATSAQSITLDQILIFPRSGRTMTNNLTVFGGLNYVASASSFAFAGREPYLAFNLVYTDFWLASSGTNEWLQIQFPLRARVRRYQLATANVNNSHHPRNWLFQAWDGSAWVTLDTKVNQFLSFNTTYNYPITNNVYYDRYRLFVQNTQTAGWAVALANLILHPV